MREIMSHPVWVRGLKQDGDVSTAIGLVAPRVGAWIETFCFGTIMLLMVVAPRVGAWIETQKNKIMDILNRRTPCGCVD